MSKLATATATTTPPCRLLFRSKKSTELYTVNDTSSSSGSNGGTTLVEGISTAHAFTPDGSRIIIHTPSQGVTLIDLTSLTATSSSAEVADASTVLEGTKGVQFLTFSSRGTYILTWERSATTSTAGSGRCGRAASCEPTRDTDAAEPRRHPHPARTLRTGRRGQPFSR